MSSSEMLLYKKDLKNSLNRLKTGNGTGLQNNQRLGFAILFAATSGAEISNNTFKTKSKLHDSTKTREINPSKCGIISIENCR